MTATTHTPGPWRWATNVSTGDASRVQRSMRYLIGDDGQGFAHTVGMRPEVDVANADLIAAAPELLEAAQAIVAALEGRVHSHAALAAVAAARAAIAKATGETA